MCFTSQTFKIMVVVALSMAATVATARADSPDAAFHRAYYLQHAEQDLAGAAQLYEEVVGAKGVDARLKAQAQDRLAQCREEIASSNLLQLMPPDAFAYVEVGSVGEQIKRLLGELGILAEPGQETTQNGQRVAISPALIDTVGIRGAAVAVTGFDPRRGAPTGVLIFHPGEIEQIRGLIETALPIAGKPSDSIGGYATYLVEDEHYVTLTRRLVIASNQKEQISGVLRRLSGEDRNSLATNEAVSELVGGRGDSLLRFFVHAEPIMPMLKGMMEAEAAHNHEVAMARALLDLDSLRSLAGRIGVSDDGLFANIELRLKEGHQNLVYNFFRTPSIDVDALSAIPQGAAAFAIGALNKTVSRHGSATTGDSETPPPVTALDFGREIFGNIATFAIFALPPDSSTGDTGGEIPDIAAAIRVNDPSKSEALWMQILGIASVASGAPTPEGQSSDIAGVAVRSYRFEDEVTLHFATLGQNVLVATSNSAMARSIAAQRGGKSITQDPAFAKSISQVGAESTKAIFAHPGRCMQIARRFMSERERAEIEPFIAQLTDTVVSLVVDHSGERLRLSTQVTGIPKIGQFLSDLVTAEQQEDERRAGLNRAMKNGEWDKAVEAVDAMLAEDPNNLGILRKKFHVLAVGQENRQAALACADVLYQAVRDDATALNNFAWALLTEDDYEKSYDKLALKFSERSNELRRDNWMFVDTLALAKYRNGDAVAAAKLEERAIELADGKAKSELEDALALYRADLD